MTRITERSSAYPGGVRKTGLSTATKFQSAGSNLDTWAAQARLGESDYGAQGIIPQGGSLELAYEPDPAAQLCDDISTYMATGAEPDGGAGASDLDRDRKREEEYERFGLDQDAPEAREPREGE